MSDGWEHLTQAQARRRALGLPPEPPEVVSKPGQSRRRQLGAVGRTHDGLRSAGPLDNPLGAAASVGRVREVDLEQAPPRAARGGIVLSCGHRTSSSAAAAEGWLRCPVCKRRATRAY